MAGEVRRRRFLREAQAIARLEHPAIVAVHDIGVHEGCPFYTMDYVPGPTLQRRLDDGPVQPVDALRLLAVIARALHHAHERGIVHRDVKPANILLEEGERPRIADFGIAQLASSGGDLTETGQVVGTPAYMAPEQASGLPGGADHRADVYSLGAVLFHMVTGSPPFSRQDLSLPQGRRHLEAPSPRRNAAHVPRELDLICRKAMALDPRDRYSDALSLAEDAERFVRGEPVLASRPGLARRLRWQLRRHRVLLTGMLMTVVVVLSLAGAWRAVAERRAEEGRRSREARAMERLEGLKGQLNAMWKEGKDDEAARILGAFLELTENQETRARSLALSFAGSREQVAGRLEQALEHYARAWLFARSDEDQARALLDLGGVFEVKGDWARLRALEPLLARTTPATSDLPGLTHFRRISALSYRDLPLLLRQLSGRAAEDFGPLLKNLGAMQSTGFAPRELHWAAGGRGHAFGPNHGDQTSALFVTGKAAGDDAWGLPLRVVMAPAGYGFWGPIIDLGTFDGAPLVAMTARKVEGGSLLSGLYRLNQSSLEPVLPLPFNSIEAACAADLNADGVPEYFIAGERKLFCAMRAPGGGLRVVPAHDETNLSNSDIQRVFPADLDGDGRLELVAVSDGWRSYDIRVFRPTAVPGRLELVARRRMGPLWDAAPFPLADGTTGILAVRYKDEPNTREFPATAPSGVPVGTYLLRLRGDRLEVVDQVPAPFKDAVLGNLVTGDFDGDGRPDFAIQVQMSHSIRTEFEREDAYLQIVSRRPDGRLAQLTLPGLVPWHAMNLDADAATELFVRDQQTGQIWVLGMGSSSLPALPRVGQKTEGSKKASIADDPWSRIDALADLGLRSVGAQELRNLAVSTPDGAAAARSLSRAGALMEANDEPAEAAVLYRAAVDRSPGAFVPLQSLAAVSRKSKLYLEEHEALTRLLASPRILGPERPGIEARLEQLKRYLNRNEVRLTFAGPVDDAWHFDAPYQIWRDVSRRALVVRAYPGQGDLARLPLEWDGGPLTLEASLEVRRAEWGGILNIGIRPAGAGPAGYLTGVRISNGGGGDQLVKHVDLLVPALFTSPVWQQRSRDAGAALPVTVRLELDPDSGEVLMEANGVQRRYPFPMATITGPGRYELYLAGDPAAGPEYGIVEAGITALTVRGARLEPTAPDPAQAAWRSLIEGQHAEAAAAARVLGRDRPEDAALVGYLAACRSGARDACLADLERFARAGELRQGQLSDIVRDQLRSSPSLIFSTLAASLGIEALNRYRDAWGGPSMAHPEDATVALALSVCPSDADLARLPGHRTFDDNLLELGLLSSQGQAWRVLGQYDTAISHLEQARRTGDALLERSGQPDQRAEVSKILSRIELNTARAFARIGQPAPVLEHLRRALERSSVPRLVAEEAAALPEIATLLSEPGFRTLLNPTAYDVPPGPGARGLEGT